MATRASRGVGLEGAAALHRHLKLVSSLAGIAVASVTIAVASATVGFGSTPPPASPQFAERAQAVDVAAQAPVPATPLREALAIIPATVAAIPASVMAAAQPMTLAAPAPPVAESVTPAVETASAALRSAPALPPTRSEAVRNVERRGERHDEHEDEDDD